MPDPGDVVTVDFVGATGLKRRPAVVVSSALYHTHRPDLVVGVLTTQTAQATTPLDCPGHKPIKTLSHALLTSSEGMRKNRW